MKSNGSASEKESGVTAYKTGKDSITVRLKEAPFLYVYSYTGAGKQVV